MVGINLPTLRVIIYDLFPLGKTDEKKNPEVILAKTKVSSKRKNDKQIDADHSFRNCTRTYVAKPVRYAIGYTTKRRCFPVLCVLNYCSHKQFNVKQNVASVLDE